MEKHRILIEIWIFVMKVEIVRNKNETWVIARLAIVLGHEFYTKYTPYFPDAHTHTHPFIRT